MELKCPHCNTVFQVDENDYAAILAQVKTAEFEKEIEKRMKELLAASQSEQRAKDLEAEKKEAERLSQKDKEIASLTTEIERLNGIVANNDARNKAALAQASESRTKELAELSSRKDKQIADLTAQVKNMQTQHQLDIINERNSSKDDIHAKEQIITELTSQLKAQEIATENKLLELKEYHSAIMKAKDEEIEHYKDMKSRMSTKMLGETLEQHCQNTFNLARSMGQFPDAYFEKDNDVRGGTKGDFIFRDYINGVECLSIMFEMKNEADTTATKHRNEDFFAKLDKDRNEKNCEYAVLVSTLEADSELYNNGILDVSYRYPKMFVVRPQFFMPVIALLSKAAKRNAEAIISLRTQLAEAKAQSIDVSEFEERRNRFATEFMKYVNAHITKQDEAMEAIDKAIESAERQIESLRKVKAIFEKSTKKLIKAGDVIENDFTIKKLVRGNPTMKAMFAEAARQKEQSSAPPLPEEES